MPLTLKIDNFDTLPDGGPVSITVDRRGIAMGRDTYLDWTLPDPNRYISGTHCEVQFRDGGYWLHDVSSNGTIVNEASGRLTEPHLLKTGDRLTIGHYIISVEVEGEEINAIQQAGPNAAYQGDIWGGIDNAAEPGNRMDFRTAAASEGSGRSGKPVQDDPMEEINWGMQRVQSSAQKDPPDSLPPLGGGGGSAPPPKVDPGLFDVPSGGGGGGGGGGDIWGSSAPPPKREPEEEVLGLGAAQERQPAPPPEFVEPEEELSLSASQQVGAPSDQASATQAPPPVRDNPLSAPPEREVPRPDQSRSEQPRSGLAAQWTDTPDQPKPDAPPLAAGAGGFLENFARGAGIPVEAIHAASEAELAEKLGQLFRLTCESLKSMLEARDKTKGAIRSADRTTIQALENNPLKFSPTVVEAMKIMLGPPTQSYLQADQAVERSFADLKDHQFRTFGAMQQALKFLFKELSPEDIAKDTPGESGLAGLVSSRRAKLWDIYVERFQARAERHEQGMVDAFMILFAEMYDAQKTG